MKVILEGEERVVSAIIRENRVRVSRGQVSFTPADSIPTPEGVTEKDVKDMAEAIEKKDSRIAELMEENKTLKATLEEKADDKDAPETTDTKEGGETDTTQAPEGDSKDAPKGDTKDVEPVTDTKGKKTSKK
jgi:uncharacterized small protein (DUF1192 family)